jgi:oligopeptide transport system ATP-binding protein
MAAARVDAPAATAAALTAPVHPYTEGLLRSMPSAELKGLELPAIPGMPPSLFSLPSGCAFRPRCPLAVDECAVAVPPLLAVAPDREAACIRRTEVPGMLV